MDVGDGQLTFTPHDQPVPAPARLSRAGRPAPARPASAPIKDHQHPAKGTAMERESSRAGPRLDEAMAAASR